MCLVVTEAKVFSVEVDEEIRDDKDHEDGDAKEDEDEEKIRLIGWELLDFHKDRMRRADWRLRLLRPDLILSLEASSV